MAERLVAPLEKAYAVPGHEVDELLLLTSWFRTRPDELRQTSPLKRVSELLELAAQNQNAIKGREYVVSDIPILQIMGASSGYIAVLVLALYVNSEEVKKLYLTPAFLWLIGPLLMLWITRLWLFTSRGQMNQDPIVWAARDPKTWMTAAATGLILYLATTVAL